MKKWIVGIVCLGFTFTALAAPKTEDEFLKELKAAIAAKDRTKILALHCFDDCPQMMKDGVGPFIDDLLQRKVAMVEIKEISPDKKKEVEEGVPYEGKRIVMNIPIVKQVVVTFEKETDPNKFGMKSLDMLLGKRGVEYFIAGSKFVEDKKK